MKVRESNLYRRAAFSLMEVMVAIVVVGIVFLAFYTSLTYGFANIRSARENLRATQIMLEKMETIRLYTWDQITETNFLPTNFVAAYYPSGITNGTGSGPVYNGKLTVTPLTNGTDYEDVMALVTVDLEWVTSDTPRRRSLSTYVSQFGLQNYVW